MSLTTLSADALKQAMKEAFTETLSEQRELLRDVLAEVLEDYAMVEAIEEGRTTEIVDREQVFDVLEGRSLITSFRTSFECDLK